MHLESPKTSTNQTHYTRYATFMSGAVHTFSAQHPKSDVTHAHEHQSYVAFKNNSSITLIVDLGF